MARPPKALALPAEDGFCPERLEAAGNAALALNDHLRQQETNVRAVAAQLGYQLPADCTDADLIQRDIAANMRRSVEACLEVGRGLRVLKEACEHGQFVAQLEVLGLDRSVAAKFMQAAGKFSNVSSTTHLTKAIGNQTKLFEMLVLDDEQLEELELTGQTGELKLDDVATMSVKELRAALREERENAAAQGRLLSDKNAKLDALAAKLERKAASGPVMTNWDERVAPFQMEITQRQSLLDAAIAKHLEAIHALDSWLTAEITAAPDYDPEAPVVLPPEVRAVVLHLDDAITRTAHLAAGLQHEMHIRFAADIEEARRNVLLPQEPEPDHDADHDAEQ